MERPLPVAFALNAAWLEEVTAVRGYSPGGCHGQALSYPCHRLAHGPLQCKEPVVGTEFDLGC